MKASKQSTMSKSKGSAPSTKTHAAHMETGNSGKHGMKRGAGKNGNKITASSTPGV